MVDPKLVQLVQTTAKLNQPNQNSIKPQKHSLTRVSPFTTSKKKISYLRMQLMLLRGLGEPEDMVQIDGGADLSVVNDLSLLHHYRKAEPEFTLCDFSVLLKVLKVMDF